MPSAATVHFVQFLIQYSSIALLYYDYILTFSSEVELIWRRKWRLSTVLYIFCRYALIANVVYLLAIAHKLTQKVICDSWYKLVAALSLFGRAAVIFTLAARTYAVFACNRIILVVLGVLGLTCIGLSVVHVPGAKCVGANDNVIASDVLSVLTCFFELVVAGLTSFRSIQELRASGSWRSQTHGLFSLIFEQGLVYFCIVSIFTTATVILNFTQTPGTFFQRLFNALTLPLSCLLTARFILKLREWQEKDTFSFTDFGVAVEDIATLPPLSFAVGFDAVMLDDFGNHDNPA